MPTPVMLLPGAYALELPLLDPVALLPLLVEGLLLFNPLVLLLGVMLALPVGEV